MYKFLVFLLVPLLCLACDSAPSESTMESGQVFRFLNEQDPATLDPNKARGVYENRVLNIIFEGLTRYGDKGKAYELGGAEKYEVNEDGKLYTFYLRKEAKWSDGSPVTAHDYIASYHRILDPKTGAEYAQMLYPIVEAEEINRGETKDFNKLGVKALDDYTLEFTLRYPVPYFLELMTHYTYFPIPRKVVEKHGDNRWTNPENIVGNGPFVLKERVLGDKLTFAKNPHYWQKDLIKLDKVIAYTTSNHETQYRMFESDAADWLCNPVSKSVYPQVKRDPSWMAPPYLGTYFLSFNTKKKPFDNPKVRRALSLAIHRTLITDRITDAGERPAHNYVPQGVAMGEGKYSPGFQFSSDHDKNVKEAKRLLAEAGYPDGKGFPPFTILYNISDQNKRICLVVQEMWSNKLGLNVKLENNEWKTYLDRLKQVNYDVARRGWIGDYNDANTFMELFLKDNGNNNTHWGKDEYDKLVKEANHVLDPQKRQQIFQKAEKILLKESPIIPIYFYVSDQMVKPYVRGFYPRIQGNDHGREDIQAGRFNVMDNHPIHYIWIDEEAKKKYLEEK